MSWLDNYPHEKQKEKIRIKKERIEEEKRRKHRVHDEKVNAIRRLRKKAKEVSPMVIRLLKDLGDTEYGQSFFFKKYSVSKSFGGIMPSAVLADSIVPPSFWWQLTGKDAETIDTGSYHIASTSTYASGLRVCIKRNKKGNFCFSVHGHTTPNLSSTSLQKAILEVLNKNKGLPKIEVDSWSENDDW